MKKLFLSILILNLINCKGQINKNENSEIKKNDMEYFDINKYKNLAIDEMYIPSSKDLYLKDGKIRIQILYSNDNVQVEETSIDNKFQSVKVFYNTNKSLKIKGLRFYGFSIGKWLYYDETGNIIKEINHDLEFKLSVEDLGKIMKEKYNIDIYDVQKTDEVHRFVDSVKMKLPIYTVYYRDETKLGILNCYVINGNTGETLFTTTRFADTEEKQGSLYDKFLKSLK